MGENVPTDLDFASVFPFVGERFGRVRPERDFVNVGDEDCFEFRVFEFDSLVEDLLEEPFAEAGFLEDLSFFFLGSVCFVFELELDRVF